MGSICNPKEPKYIQEKQHERDVLRLDDISQLKSIRFQFTTQLLIHVQADLLVLFMQHTTNMRRNDHFNKLPVQGAKIQQHAKAQLIRKGGSNAMPQQPFVTFNIIIPTLNFRRVSIVFCNIWKEDQHNDTQFKKQLGDYFQSLAQLQLKSIAIAQFSSELGVHLQKGVKRIMREIVKMPNKPQVIDFVCLTEASKTIYMEAVNNHSDDVKRSFASSVGSQESNYY